MFKASPLLLIAIAFHFTVKAQGQSQSPILSSSISYGYEYKDYYQNMYESKHPFYNKNGFVRGDVTYFGRRYTNVLLKYDLIKDQLITLYTDGISQIMLIPEQVDSFTLYSQTFVRMAKQDGMPSGYYARIYHGKNYVLYGRYTRNMMQQQYINGGMYDVVSNRDYYYLQLNDKYHPVKSLNNLAELLSAPKKQVKSFKRTDNSDVANAEPDMPSNHYLAYVKYYEAAQ